MCLCKLVFIIMLFLPQWDCHASFCVTQTNRRRIPCTKEGRFVCVLTASSACLPLTIHQEQWTHILDPLAIKNCKKCAYYFRHDPVCLSSPICRWSPALVQIGQKLFLHETHVHFCAHHLKRSAQNIHRSEKSFIREPNIFSPKLSTNLP
jgi:hypothetical protein